MAIQSRTVKGQPWILGDSLVQDQILLVTTDNRTVREATGVYTVVQNIWEDLLSTTGTWKKVKKSFFWEVEVSDTSDDRGTDAIVKQLFECPKPEPELFGYDFEPKSSDSEWTLYWKGKFKTAESSVYNGTNAVYRKEVILPGTKYIKFGNALTQGQDVKVENESGEWTSEEIKVDQTVVDMHDTMNLLATSGEDTTGKIHTDLSDISGLLSTLL